MPGSTCHHVDWVKYCKEERLTWYLVEAQLVDVIVVVVVTVFNSEGTSMSRSRKSPGDWGQLFWTSSFAGMDKPWQIPSDTSTCS